MSTLMQEYKAKLRTADEAVQVVQSGGWVYYDILGMNPIALDEALAKRTDELRNVVIRGSARPIPSKCVMADLDGKSFIYHSGLYLGWERLMAEHQVIFQIAGNYSAAIPTIKNGYYYPYGTPSVAFLHTTPMNEKGYFNFSLTNSYNMTMVEEVDIVIVEANDQAPVCLGGINEAVHISQVDYIVETSNPLICLPDIPSSDIDKQISKYILEELEDGCCIQLGIGALPNALGKMIANSGLKNLGAHSEMFCDAFVDLIEKGVLNGSKKNFDRYKVVWTFTMGTKRLYDYIDNNPVSASCSCDYVNPPARIALNDKMISINSCLEVDLYSQINSESDGITQISGTGGALDFVQGAMCSKGGKSFLCVPSTYTDKEGNIHSNIVPFFKPGTRVTIPRTYVDRVVTEYGIAPIRGLPNWLRAENLIKIAHPKFRDELIKAANEQKIWRKTNKIPY